MNIFVDIYSMPETSDFNRLFGLFMVKYILMIEYLLKNNNYSQVATLR